MADFVAGQVGRAILKRSRTVTARAGTRRRPRLQAQVNRLVRASNQRELYAIATGFTVDPNTTGAVVALTAIATGDTTTTRAGRQVILKKIIASGIVTRHASASNSHVRMMIVRDNIGNTTPPAIADLFTSVTQFADNKPQIETSQVRQRFTVLMDKWFQMDTGGSGLTKTFKFRKVLNTRCYFTGSASTDGGTNNLYLFIASNEATNDPVVNASCEVLWVNP